jgi:hypothetical protein
MMFKGYIEARFVPASIPWRLDHCIHGLGTRSHRRVTKMNWIENKFNPYLIAVGVAEASANYTRSLSETASNCFLSDHRTSTRGIGGVENSIGAPRGEYYPQRFHQDVNIKNHAS